MFSTIGSRPHSDRKRLQSNIYSKSYLQSSEDIRAISTAVVIDRLIPILDKLAETGQEFDIMETLYSATMDLVTAFQFGLSSSTDFLCDVAERRRWLELYQKRHIHRFAFFSQEFPTLTSFLAKLQIRLVPRWVDDANAQLEAWCLSHVDRCLATHSSGAQPPGFNPVVVNALYEGLIRQDPSLTPSQARLLVASELLDQVAAGHETSSLTMTQLILHLSAFPNLQGLLHREFSSLPHDPPPSPRELDAFPLLQVVLRETLRLTPPIPGPQPRITPPSGCFLTPPSGKQYFIPRDVRISASAYALHRNPDVFPMPTAWRPDRWLDNFISTPASSPGRSMNGPDKSTATSETETKDRYFWAFGSGGRMCLGSNLAMLQMKLLIAALYARYKTVVVEGQDTSVADGYMGYIGNGKLMIRLEKWEASGRSRPDSAISMGSGESGV
ncbi:MAG: hypothetical protein M1814_002283 [Vezdaea aestivalis]|nr:MAG: hypothetical protein M1814_002283 [Vezdaea aestivalis]